MTLKEIKRVEVMKLIESGTITGKQASEMLGVSLRQTRCKVTGLRLGTITINHSAFAPGNYDGANPKLYKKTYAYNPHTNSLLICDDGTPIYANDNGTICHDQAALADSLFD